MEQVALVVGESLVDVVQRMDGSVVEHAGGSAANAAVALARLGRSVRLATSFAADPYGRLIADHLARDGVELATDPAVVARTSSAVARIGSDGAASYEFDIDWRLGPVALEDIRPIVVHACSLGAVLAPGCERVLEIVTSARSRATITYDINVRAAVTGVTGDVVAGIERLVALSDIVKASDEDLEALYPHRSHEQSARALLGLGATAVVLTRGGAGATRFGATGRVDVPAVAGPVVDTIGAGDTFGAALIDALWDRGALGAERRPVLTELDAVAWDEVLTYAARASAVTVSRPGADPPYRRELAPRDR